MDQYKEQYKKETEEIHAPADLIAKTKAAVREEEVRIQRERASQTAGLGMQAVPAVRRAVNRGAATRKWAYPLTIAAAIFILVSVSLMMRGLGKSGSDTASYELASEADSGGEESASGAAFEEEAPEAAVVSEEAVEEGTESGVFDSVTSVEETEHMTSDREAASVAEDEVSDGETVVTGGTTDFADETKRAAAAEASESPLEEDAISQKKEVAADSEAQKEGVTITKVWKKPVFVDRSETESRTYEDATFLVTKENDEWIAYVESENGGGYVIRGEAETMEAFLEAGYKRLLEISF